MRGVAGRAGWAGLSALVPLALWIAWALVSTVRSDWGWSGAAPYVLCPVVLILGVAAGGMLGGRRTSPGLRLCLLIVSVGLVLGVLLATEPGKDPLGYANANAALAVQVVALCGLALLATPPRGPLTLTVALLLGVAAVALNRSTAGMAVVVPVAVVIAMALWHRPVHRWWAVVLAVGTSLAGAAVILRLAQGTRFPPWARGVFDTVREQLWHDALALWQRHPLTGSGPGSFRAATDLAVDPDTMAAHSSVLQIGAETGWIGVILGGLVVLTGLLWAARGRAPEAVVAVAAWTALLVQSYADHLLEFGPVIFSAGLVLGWAGASRPAGGFGSEQLDVGEGERPVLG